MTHPSCPLWQGPPSGGPFSLHPRGFLLRENQAPLMGPDHTCKGGVDMDFFWFFVGLAMVIAVLGMLKVSTIND